MRFKRLSKRIAAATAGVLAAAALVSSTALAAAPQVLTEAASGETATSATLHGELNTGASSEKLKYEFTYNAGTSCEGSRVPEPPAEAEGNHKKVEIPLAGLAPSTQYTFCVSAENAAKETATGAPLSFTTSGAKPAVASESVSATPFSATLEASINPENRVTTYHFEFASNPGLTGARPLDEGALPAVFENQTVGPFEVGGLLPETSYYYRVVASNATGTEDGPTESFETKGLERPQVGSETVSGLTQTAAVFSSVVDPEFQNTFCEGWQYVDQQAFEEHEFVDAPEAVCGPHEIGGGGGFEAVGSRELSLTANTTYHFRVLAKNASGLSEGVDETFTTPPYPPTVLTGGASLVTGTSAQISGSVDPGSVGPSSSTTYLFQYGPTASYGTEIPLTAGDAGEGESAIEEAASLTGLEAGTTYHYRIVASNNNSGTPQTSYGADETFTTTPAPPTLAGVSVSETQSTATVSATLDPQNLPTRYELQLGQTPGALETITAANTTSTTPLALTASSLSPNTVYYYTLTAANQDGPATPLEGAILTPTAPEAASPIPQPQTPPLLQTPNVKFPTPPVPTRPLTTKEKLEKALKACRKDKTKTKRAACEHQAHKKYPVKKKT